jgi:hypothetical protein
MKDKTMKITKNEAVTMGHLNTQGRTITESQVRELIAASGEVICTGTYNECKQAADRHGLTVGTDCLINNVWSL